MQQPEAPPAVKELKTVEMRARQVEQRIKVFKARRSHVVQVSASLGVIAALLGSGLLSVLLSPQWASQDARNAQGYCRTAHFGGTSSPESSCEKWWEFFWIMATLSFALTCCTLLLSFAAVYGFDNFLPFAFFSFWLSLCSLSMAVVATSWIVYSAGAAIAATCLMSILAIFTVLIILPTAMWTWDMTSDKQEIETCQIQWTDDTLNQNKDKNGKDIPVRFYDLGRLKLSGGDIIHYAASKAGGHIREDDGIFTSWKHPFLFLLFLCFGQRRAARFFYKKWSRWYYLHEVKLLLASGVEPTQTFGTLDVSPILLVFQTKEGEHINLKLARVLLQAGVNANSKDDRGWSLLRKAVFRNEPKLVDLLCNYGADPEEKFGDSGDSLLHLAVKIEAGLVRKYAGKNNDEDITECFGFHQFWRSIVQRIHSLVVRPDAGKKDENDGKNNDEDITKRFGFHQFWRSSVQWIQSFLVKERKPDTLIGMLIKHGADLNALNNRNESPLYIGVMMNSCSLFTSANVKEFEKKIKIGVEKEIKICEMQGPKATSLHWAVYNDNQELVETILENMDGKERERKQFLDQRDEDGNTALNFATSEGVVKLLLDHGADPYLRRDGKLPIEIAISGDYELFASNDKEKDEIVLSIVKVYGEARNETPGVKPIDPESPEKKMSDIALEKNLLETAKYIREAEKGEEMGTKRQLNFNDAASLEPARADGPLLQETRDDSIV